MSSVSLDRRYTRLDMEEDRDEATSRPLTADENELVGNTAQQRNWRGIAIALLVILIVCALIVTAVIIATPKEDLNKLGEKFTFDDYINQALRPASFEAQWIPGSNQFLYQTKDLEIRLFNCSSNSSISLMDNSTFKQIEPKEFTLSADGKYLLLKYRVIQKYRHSTEAEYAVYNIHTKDNPEPVRGLGNNPDRNPDVLQYVAWSPTGHSLILVEHYDILYKADIMSTPVQLTTTGVKGRIYNGIPDWVYEEEILATDNAIWWSTESTYILYATFDDSKVPVYQFPWYGDLTNPYTSDHKIAYPKPGYPNPVFNLTIINPKTKDEFVLPPPTELTQGLVVDYYFTTVVWRNDEEVLVTWMDRAQRNAHLTLCSAKTKTCQKSLDVSATTGWLDLAVPPLFSQDGSRYFLILPEREGEDNYFKHVAMVEVRDGNQRDKLTFLTTGLWEVSRIVAYDDLAETIYFTSPYTDPRELHLYSVSTSSKQETCLTCDYHKDCLYNDVSMATTTDFYILKCLGPGVPKYSLLSKDGLEIDRLENNTAFAEEISKFAMPWVKYEQITLENGEKIWGKLLLPPVLKEEEILTYPLVLQVYAAPGTQTITRKYSIDWYTYMTSSRHVIWAFVDPRGASGRGDKFTHSLYWGLGTHEVDDSLTAAKHYAKLHYVKGDNMAIWGWSYGGFVAASALGRGKDTFKCGISVAPVTDWIYYDSVYTERYMGLPDSDENLKGYRYANVSKYAEGFRKASFMLVHGTGDDNVHFQQSAQLIKALTEADVYFRLQVYPDKHHGLTGGNVRRHLYETMEDFVIECFHGVSEIFGEDPPPEYVKTPPTPKRKKKINQ